VATQSLVEVSYGPKGLELMRNGKSAEDALKELLDRDDHADVRQVAMIDVRGNVDVHTGKRCIADAGDHKGENYSCQANLMANDKIWGAMAQAFETSKGDLAERLLRALEAGPGVVVVVAGIDPAQEVFWQPSLLFKPAK